MNRFYLALGSNLNPCLEKLKNAINLMQKKGINVISSSPIFKTPAIMLNGAPSKFNLPFLNIVVKAEADISPLELLKIIKDVETEMGREIIHEKWSPRVIDIDIITFNDEKINTDTLKIPHPLAEERAFVLDPLSHLEPSLFLNGKSVLELTRKNRFHQPLIMGILNITPDSFSDGGKYLDIAHATEIINLWEKNLVDIIDIGAESTRPNATPLTEDEECARLKNIFAIVKIEAKQILRPLFSLDTYHPATAQIALENGFDIINDVSGLTNPLMIKLAKSSAKTFIAMHSISIPVNNKNAAFNDDDDAVQNIKLWLETQLKVWEKEGLDLNKIIFDPGIGFGKNPHQSLQILQQIEEFKSYGLRILIGHSRKSFMNIFTEKAFADRDLETLAMSLEIMHKNIDILRVHAPIKHKQAIIAALHTKKQFC